MQECGKSEFNPSCSQGNSAGLDFFLFLFFKGDFLKR